MARKAIGQVIPPKGKQKSWPSASPPTASDDSSARQARGRLEPPARVESPRKTEPGRRRAWTARPRHQTDRDPRPGAGAAYRARCLPILGSGALASTALDTVAGG